MIYPQYTPLQGRPQGGGVIGSHLAQARTPNGAETSRVFSPRVRRAQKTVAKRILDGI